MSNITLTQSFNKINLLFSSSFVHFLFINFTNNLFAVGQISVVLLLTATQKTSISKFPHICLTFSSEKSRWCSVEQQDHLAKVIKTRLGNQLPATEGNFWVNTVRIFINSQNKKKRGGGGGTTTVQFLLYYS